MNKTTEAVSNEIHDATSATIEIPMPTKVTGYIAFYRSVGMTNWSDVYSLPQKEFHPVLPHGVFASRDEAIKAAMQISYLKPISIKVVLVEFEV